METQWEDLFDTETNEDDASDTEGTLWDATVSRICNGG